MKKALLLVALLLSSSSFCMNNNWWLNVAYHAGRTAAVGTAAALTTGISFVTMPAVTSITGKALTVLTVNEAQLLTKALLKK